MGSCEGCNSYKNPCPGVESGVFCTDLIDESKAPLHPANTDTQNAGLSCEMAYFYEERALDAERARSSGK